MDDPLARLRERCDVTVHENEFGIPREELLLVGEGERNAAQTRGGRPVADLAPWLATTG